MHGRLHPRPLASLAVFEIGFSTSLRQHILSSSSRGRALAGLCRLSGMAFHARAISLTVAACRRLPFTTSAGRVYAWIFLAAMRTLLASSSS